MVEIMGYCDLHEEDVDEDTFEYKGCWTCQHFYRTKDYMTVAEAVEEYQVSKYRIYKWIKKDKLKARLFVMGRRNLNVPKKFYAIFPQSEDE